ncbi:Alpha-(1 6)-fucosyltransferase [Mactra antiquata]
MNFNELLENVCLLNSCFNEKECIVLGDLNTDVSNSISNILNNSCKSFIDMFSFTQLISDFTRVCDKSSSIIDLILVSDECKISQSGVLNVGISDHSAVFCTRKVTKEAINKHKNIKVRSLKRYSKDSFLANLINTD